MVAARAALVEGGMHTPIDDIARRAEVGVGTIYRRFGDRDTLVREVVLASVADLTRSARQAAASGETPWVGFAQFVHAAYGIRIGLVAPLLLPVIAGPLRDDQEFRQMRDDLLAAVDVLLQRAQQDGSVRQDVGLGDVLLAIAKASRPIPGVPAELDSAQSGRIIVLLLDGLHTRTTSALPGAALTEVDLDRALSELA